LQYDACVVKEKEERGGGEEGGEKVMQDFAGVTKKKNIIESREGLPRLEDYSSDPLSPKLVIIDDLMKKSSSSEVIVDLFTKGSHHKNLSIILISQNLFHQGRGQRDISLDANYIVVFKNPRDRAQIRHLAR